MAQHLTEITWFGHSTFRVRTPGGKQILLDAWVNTNPATPDNLRNLENLDAILITHGHFDHLNDAVSLAKKTGATVVGIFEIANWLQQQGVPNTAEMNLGGTQTVHGLKITMIQAFHSTGIANPNGNLVYGGTAAGFIVELENGFRLYHTGDTALFGDLRLIGEVYRPDLAFIPIGGLYTMGPREASYAVRFLNVRQVIPMHFGTFPALPGTPDDFIRLTQDIPDLNIRVMQPGETITF